MRVKSRRRHALKLPQGPSAYLCAQCTATQRVCHNTVQNNSIGERHREISSCYVYMPCPCQHPLCPAVKVPGHHTHRREERVLPKSGPRNLLFAHERVQVVRQLRRGRLQGSELRLAVCAAHVGLMKLRDGHEAVLTRVTRPVLLLIPAGGDLLQEVCHALARGDAEPQRVEEGHHVLTGAMVDDLALAAGR